MTDATVTAYLAEVREAARVLAQTNVPSIATVRRIRRMTGHAETLASAVEAILTLADEWESEATRSEDLASAASSIITDMRAGMLRARAEALRSAVSAALPGEDGSQ